MAEVPYVRAPISQLALALLASSALMVACQGNDRAVGSPSSDTRHDLADAFEEFYEAFLASDAERLDGLVSSGCAYKQEFIESVDEWKGLWPNDLTVSVPSDLLVIQEQTPTRVVFIVDNEDQPVYLNDVPITNDDPETRDIPLEFVLEGGSWRLANCDDPRLTIRIGD
jgi:hypothetical protein